MDTTKLEKEFLHWLVRDDRGPKITEASGKKYVGQMALFVDQMGGRHPCHMGKSEILTWREALPDRYAASTVNVKIAMLNHLFSWLQEVGRRADNPVGALKYESVPKRQPRPLSQKELTRMFKVAESLAHREREGLAFQDLVMVEVLYSSGLRRSELAGLRLSHVETDDTLRVVGKGNKERTTILTDRAFTLLASLAVRHHGDEQTEKILHMLEGDWHATFRDLRKRKPNEGFFISEDGTPLLELSEPDQVVYRRVKHLLDAAEVEGSPHQLRHSFATDLTDEGVDLGILQDLLGHEDISTTKIYSRPGKKALRRVKGLHPRNR